MNPIRISDRMVTQDDLIITNKIHHECAAPHGRLFQVLGVNEDGRRVVREIACNTVVVGGAITALENLVGTEASWKPSSLNDIYNVSASSTDKPTLALFGVGTGGSNLDFGSVIAPNIKQRDVMSPIPMRYGETLTGDDADKYFMKVPASDGLSNCWYLKQFSETPIIKSCWKNAVSSDADGTEIMSDIYDNPSTDGIETFTEIKINLNTSDVREYFEATGAISEARYNTIGFYTGSYDKDKNEYANVRLYSVVTFNNRDVSLATNSSFLYRVLSLT